MCSLSLLQKSTNNDFSLVTQFKYKSANFVRFGSFGFGLYWICSIVFSLVSTQFPKAVKLSFPPEAPGYFLRSRVDYIPWRK